MLKYVKSIISNFLDYFGYDLICRKIVNDSDDPYNILQKVINNDDVKVIVDAGASLGDTSVRFSSYFPYATVYAFEPYPPFLEKLKEKSAENKSIFVEPFALGKGCTKSFLNVNHCEGTNSLFESNEDAFNIYGSLLSSKSKIEVEIKSLDMWSKEKGIGNIDILKLDLQGGEFDALEGAIQLFSSSNIKIVICEIMFNKCYNNKGKWTDIVNFLENYNLQLFNIYQPFHHYGKIIQADLIFISKEVNYEEVTSECFHAYSKLLK